MILRLVHVSYSLAESDFLYTVKRACIHAADLWISECVYVCVCVCVCGGLWVVSEKPARDLTYPHALHDLTAKTKTTRAPAE